MHGGVTGRRHSPVLASCLAAPDPPSRVPAAQPLHVSILGVPAVAGAHHGGTATRSAVAVAPSSLVRPPSRTPPGGGRRCCRWEQRQLGTRGMGRLRGRAVGVTAVSGWRGLTMPADGQRMTDCRVRSRAARSRSAGGPPGPVGAAARCGGPGRGRTGPPREEASTCEAPRVPELLQPASQRGRPAPRAAPTPGWHGGAHRHDRSHVAARMASTSPGPFLRARSSVASSATSPGPSPAPPTPSRGLI